MPFVLTAKIAPWSFVPPWTVVPYNVPPTSTNSACGFAPSLPPVKLYIFVKPVPSVLIAKTAPSSFVPPFTVVP